jgi:hypothetical protein
MSIAAKRPQPILLDIRSQASTDLKSAARKVAAFPRRV